MIHAWLAVPPLQGSLVGVLDAPGRCPGLIYFALSALLSKHAVLADWKFVGGIWIGALRGRAARATFLSEFICIHPRHLDICVHLRNLWTRRDEANLSLLPEENLERSLESATVSSVHPLFPVRIQCVLTSSRVQRLLQSIGEVSRETRGSGVGAGCLAGRDARPTLRG